MKPHRPYTLEEYNPVWKEIFIDVSTRVKNILGDMVLAVEHIGSTSVNGMLAKPQVDMLIVVKDLNLVPAKYQEMIDSGFIHHGREYVNGDNDYFSLDTKEGVRVASIHVLQEGNAKIKYYRFFRDYLQSHEEERNLYTSVKRELYSKYRDSYSDYNTGKEEVILAIRARAVQWYEGLGPQK
jgi:GrpB-like predicted nucleotidyltransferase (UPF0157 family)